MNFRDFEKFFEYRPVMDEDPRGLVDELIKKAEKYLGREARAGILAAYEFARDAHAGQKRHSGEPYIVHPVQSALFLMELQPDLVTIQACLLHDVIEDTPVEAPEVRQHFGTEVLKLCEALDKVSRIRYQGEDRQIETIKKTFLAMAEDLRVIFIKLADRIHNIQTIGFHPKIEKQKKIAEETMKMYVPVCKRLGLFGFQFFLENGAFRVLDPENFGRVVDRIGKKFGDDANVEAGEKKLERLLKKEGLEEFRVRGRLKSPYRIRDKMQRKYKTDDFEKVTDVLAFRIVTDSVTNVYLSLGIVHKHFSPLINKIKDYIAVPKFNGYRSVHTTVLGMFRFPVEVQIRTEEMNEIAELGVAAHYAYSENGHAVNVSPQQADWIGRLQQLVKEYTEVEEREKFKKELSVDILNASIFVYTPKGDIIELPRGATALDFAFSVHTEIGLKFKHALVNWEIKPMTYGLKTGDVVMIQTRKNKFTASEDWMDFLFTSDARSAVQRFLRQKQKDLILQTLTSELNFRLKEEGFPAIGGAGDAVSKKYSKAELERNLFEIGDRKQTVTRFLKTVYPNFGVEKIEKKTKTPKKSEPKPRVVVDGIEFSQYHFCSQCRAKLGDRIIAKTGRWGIKIHRTDCRALAQTKLDHLLPAHRSDELPVAYNFKIFLEIPNQHGALIDVMELFHEIKLQLEKMVVSHEGEKQVVALEIQYFHPSRAASLLETMKKRRDITVKEFVFA